MRTSAFRSVPLVAVMWSVGSAVSPALSQSVSIPAGTMRIAPTPARFPWSLHPGAGSWVQLGTSMPGADVVYNNTSDPGFFAALSPGEVLFDVGRIPSDTYPSSGAATSGCATSTLITGFEISYCTDMSSVDVRVRFYNQHNECFFAPTQPVAALDLNGLPGSGSGAMVCWIVTVALRGSPDLSFPLLNDGDGDWDPPTVTDDTFGWSIEFTNVSGPRTGPYAGGDILTGPKGTRFSPGVVDYSESGDGLSNGGGVYVMPQGVCSDWWPYARGPYLRLFADACGTLAGAPFCTGDGSGTACPCGPSPGLNREGCPNSVNGVNGGRLEAIGTASLSADSVLLRALRLPGSTSALFFQGTQRVQGGAGELFGDGLRCAGGSVLRLGTKQAVAGQVEYPGAGDARVSVRGAIAAPGTRTYQVWYRNTANYCTPAAFNLTNGWELDWQA